MVLMQDQHRFNTRAWLLWTAGFLAFPIAGVLATALVGRINDAGSALIGGMVAGAVIGTANGWSPDACSTPRPGSRPPPWPWASGCWSAPGRSAMAPAWVSWP
jgi:hypothetical protein